MAHAQRGVDVQFGTWSVSGANSTLYSASYWRPVMGPLDFGITGFALVSSESFDRSLYGLGPGISLFKGSSRLSPYLMAGLGAAAVSGGDADVAAVWSAGGGLEYNPRSWFGLALEVSRVVEDDGFHGFWNVTVDDRKGWLVSARVSFRWGGRARGGSRSSGSSSSYTPADPLPISSEPAEPLSESGATLAYDIVDTAVSVMGEPYRWGGTSTDEGFDCSGLIWYAYDAYGVSVPRVSRQQAQAGRPVPRQVSALEPGDILLFANGGEGVSHVGLFIGNRRFIHATTSGGVKVSELETTDSYNRWWMERWVGARRVLR
ncbi:MAG TPA: C40 family peptidase [Gemmatimonadota bacterium]|nr:C40 family peptidase [Gemmatimonadota bacterium]